MPAPLLTSEHACAFCAAHPLPNRHLRLDTGLAPEPPRSHIAPRARIAELQGEGAAVTSEPIVFELLRGARDDANYQRLDASLRVLPRLPVSPDRWQEAAALGYRLLRRHGMTFPANDLLIACVAMAHGATLVHRDGDFDLIAAHAPLTVESHV